ncbi:putative damage-inducible protein DinB [Planifilum fimeticola]|jgi:hypothetical protein|uniref:Putative damage-inducible protein DinB n=1 Tax=Planifilum fimeticola TaxID=201975 RepID=A0A2T0LFI5_9BACL|nr:DinB family protein [Planifilum fimeticola]PRX40979.1 putative damage-inducible protein DinB [Planifilum fimeticola]
MDANARIRQKVWREVERLSDEEINRKPSPDRWSIAQILEHLYLTELTVARRMKKAADRTDKQISGEKPIRLLLDRSLRVKVPIPDLEPSDDFKTLDSLREKLCRSHRFFAGVLRDLTPDQLRRCSMRHPLFGTMSLEQWVEFVSLHEQRHLEQIRETRERLGLHREPDGDEAGE